MSNFEREQKSVSEEQGQLAEKVRSDVTSRFHGIAEALTKPVTPQERKALIDSLRGVIAVLENDDAFPGYEERAKEAKFEKIEPKEAERLLNAYKALDNPRTCTLYRESPDTSQYAGWEIDGGGELVSTVSVAHDLSKKVLSITVRGRVDSIPGFSEDLLIAVEGVDGRVRFIGERPIKTDAEDEFIVSLHLPTAELGLNPWKEDCRIIVGHHKRQA